VANLSPDKIRKIIHTYVRETLDAWEIEKSESGYIPIDDLKRNRDELTDLIAHTSLDFQHHEISNISCLAKDLLGKAGYSIDPENIEFKVFCRRLQKANIKLWEVEKNRISTDYSDNVEKLFPVSVSGDKPKQDSTPQAEPTEQESITLQIPGQL